MFVQFKLKWPYITFDLQHKQCGSCKQHLSSTCYVLHPYSNIQRFYSLTSLTTNGMWPSPKQLRYWRHYGGIHVPNYAFHQDYPLWDLLITRFPKRTLVTPNKLSHPPKAAGFSPLNMKNLYSKYAKEEKIKINNINWKIRAWFGFEHGQCQYGQPK